jgi:anionic cell wall polymer biosynthesis LytR-Cps2A-Psr (LCP) family protein
MAENNINTVNDKNNKKNEYKHIALIIVTIAVTAIAAVAVAGAFISNAGKKHIQGELRGNTPELPSGCQDTAEPGVISYNGEKYEYDQDNINILFMGIDARGEDSNLGQADTNILIAINPDKKTLKCISINRDCIGPVKLFSVSGDYISTENLQIALAFAYGENVEEGCGLMRDTVSELLYNLPIHRYVALDIDGISWMNSLVGGVKLIALENVDKAGITEGDEVTLTDEQAFYYVTERDSESADIGTNGKRMERQKQYITAWIEKFKEKIGDSPENVYNCYRGAEKYITTDMDKKDILYMAKVVLDIDLTDDFVCNLPGQYERDGYFDQYILDDAEVTETMLDIFYKKVK